MEIRCSECGHLGAAAEIRPLEEGVGLVCAECGHVHPMAPGKNTDELGRDGALPQEQTEPEPSEEVSENGNSVFVEESLKRLIPEPGEGDRCRKCFHILKGATEHCARCGLSLAEAEHYADGEAPWEMPADEFQEVHQRAMKIWLELVDAPTSTLMESFVDFVIEEEMVDFGIRKIQLFLIDHPDDASALEGLERLARRLEVAVSMARTTAEAKSDEFNEEVKVLRTRLLVGALIFWTVILLLFSWLFWDKM